MGGVQPSVVVTGLSLVTALGKNASENWQRLVAGESAIALRQPFLDQAPGPLAMAGKRPVSLSALIRQLAEQACQDAELSSTDLPQDQCGVVIGSSRSYLQSLEAFSLAHRQTPGQITDDWIGALAHWPAIEVARQVGATGPVLAPMAACATGMWAIAQAADLIRSGRCQRVIAGAVEAPITPLTLAGFRKMGALAKTGCFPFDCDHEGFVLGEGGALFVLESGDLAKARGAEKIYGELLGIGLTNDSYHVSAFDPTYSMGKRALQLALSRSHLRPDDVDTVHTHGTSTTQNDQMEAHLIRHCLRDRTPVMASKGSTGHTLGASGAVTVALSLLSLKHQQLIPCVGLKKPAFPLNFVRQTTAAELNHLLCFSFGFGGQNAVLALKRP